MQNIIHTYIFAFGSSIVGFIIVILFSRYLSPEEWGVFSVVKRSATLAATISLLGVAVAVTRYIPLQRAKRSHYADYYSTNAVGVIGYSTVGIVILWGGGLFVLRQMIDINVSYLIALHSATLFIIALMWQLLLTGLLRAEGYIRNYNYMTFAGQSMQLLCGLLSILIFGASAYITIFGASVGIVVVICFSCYLLIRLGVQIYKKEYVNNTIRGELLSYGLPRMTMAIFDVLVVSTSLILLGYTGMTIEAGYLAIGLQFVALLTLVFQPIAVVLLPEFSKLYGLADKDKIEKNIQVLLQGWLYFIIFIVLMLASSIDYIFPFIMKVEYLPAIMLIKILMFGMIGYSLYLTTYSYINAVVYRPYLLYMLIIAFIVNIILYYILVPVLGGLGAAVSTSVGMVVLGAMVLLLLLRLQPKPFARINMRDFMICNIPIILIFILSIFNIEIIIKIVFDLVLLFLYVWLLKRKDIEWFNLFIVNINKNYLKR